MPSANRKPRSIGEMRASASGRKVPLRYAMDMVDSAGRRRAIPAALTSEQVAEEQHYMVPEALEEAGLVHRCKGDQRFFQQHVAVLADGQGAQLLALFDR